LVSLRLLFKQQEYPWSKVIIIDEAYTSKTCTNCGRINWKLGGNKVFKCNNKKCNIVLDRDIVGARNIIIRYLTDYGIINKAAEMPLFLDLSEMMTASSKDVHIPII